MQNSNIPTARRPRRSADQWRTLVNRFEKNDLTIKDFCEQENLSRGTFGRWRSNILKESSLPGFIELQPPSISSSTAEPWSLELDLPGGGHLSIRSGL